MDRIDVHDMAELLLERGYEASETVYADVYALIASGMGSIKVVAYHAGKARVVALDKFGTQRWHLPLGEGVPLSVAMDVINAVEAELSAIGRPVTGMAEVLAREARR